jgi:hypothetical protein
MKTYGGVEVHLHAFLISEQGGGEWSASRPGRFILKEESRYPLYRSLCGPKSRSGRGGEEERTPAPPGNRNPVV